MELSSDFVPMSDAQMESAHRVLGYPTNALMGSYQRVEEVKLLGRQLHRQVQHMADALAAAQEKILELEAREPETPDAEAPMDEQEIQDDVFTDGNWLA